MRIKALDLLLHEIAEAHSIYFPPLLVLLLSVISAVDS